MYNDVNDIQKSSLLNDMWSSHC